MIRRLHLRPAAFVLVFGACAEAGAPAPGPDAFPGSAASLQELGGAVVEALAAQDTAALEGFRLTEVEHNGTVYPELPAGSPEAGFPVDLAWQNITLRNARDRDRQLRWFRAREVDHVETVCTGPTQSFESFVVHTDCVVRFDDAAEGRLEVALFEDVLERDGGFKIFRYYDHTPRRVDAP